MPTLRERRKERLEKARRTQRQALRVQRGRVKWFRKIRALVRKGRSNIAKRRKLIESLEALVEGVQFKGNRATGGSPRQRLVAIAAAAVRQHALGNRKSFYSQPGKWTVRYAISGEPRGYRSDCSQWVTSVYWSAGLPDPNGNDYGWGFTGTLGSNGRRVSRRDAKPGDLGMYGSGSFHHVEMVLEVDNDGPTRYAGHGSPPVDSITPGEPDVFISYEGMWD